MAKKWYVVHTQSGCEQKVKETIELKVKTMGLESYIGRVLAPVENVVVMGKGIKSKKGVVKKPVYPGYVLIEMELTDEIQRLIRRVPKITGFVGAGKDPLPVEGKDLESLLEVVEGRQKAPELKMDYRRGDAIRIVEGPLENYQGNVEDIYPDKGKLKVMLLIFGRSTPVELELSQVEKL